QRPVVNVGEVQLHPVFKADLITAADLPKARHAGFHAETAALPTFVSRDLLRNRRTGTDQAHVAAQNVKDLGQFIDTESSDDLADNRDPRIARGFENRAVHFVQRVDILAQSLGVIDHRPEFVHDELTPVKTAAYL